MKIRLYQILVNRSLYISESYSKYRTKSNSRIKDLLYLGWLNVSNIFLGTQYMNQKKKGIPLSVNESLLSQYPAPEQLVKSLLSYDVISFDIWDTLILRPFGSPSDLFFLVGEKLKYMDYVHIRQEAEKKARNKKYHSKGTYEVTIEEIYDEVEYMTGISKKEGLRIELETEYNLCFPSTYMLEVYKLLKVHGKKLICVSDMYIPKKYMEDILNKCGYDCFDEIFISCDYLKSKNEGTLYQTVKDRYSSDLSIIHIGDNKYSDIKMAQKYQIETFWIENVNEKGNVFRTKDMSAIVGSAYRGITNAKIHNKCTILSPEYEYGYIYGGLFVLGYCNFISEYAKQNNIDKVIFLSRDGDILKQAYDYLFPGNTSEYVYWSRVISTKLAAKYFRYDYMRRFLYQKVNQHILIKDIFMSMGIENMLVNIQYKPQDTLTSKNVECISDYLLHHMDEVVKHYDEASEAAKLYYTNVLQGHERVCAVDVGWAGSGAISLKHLVENEWSIPCKIYGIVGGTTSVHNFDRNISETFLQNRDLVSYMYSQSFNRNIWLSHDLTKNHNLYFELLLSSIHPTFCGFEKRGEEIQLKFGKKDDNQSGIREIQKGILDFVADYTAAFNKYPFMMNISGQDAYAPFLYAAENSSKYLDKIGDKFKFNPLIG